MLLLLGTLEPRMGVESSALQIEVQWRFVCSEWPNQVQALHLIDGKQRKNGAKHGKNGEAPGKEENGANSRIIGTKCTNTCPVVNSKFGVGLSIATNSVCIHWNKWAKNETQILKCPKCWKLCCLTLVQHCNHSRPSASVEETLKTKSKGRGLGDLSKVSTNYGSATRCTNSWPPAHK